MKINELSQYSGVKVETIRKYREKGLIRPSKSEENGYFDYSDLDFINLLNIRKLRGTNLPLKDIDFMYHHSDIEKILDGFHQERARLEKQIEELQLRMDMMQITLDHLEYFSQCNENAVEVISAFDTKLDAYFSESQGDTALEEWVRNMDLCTQVIRIRKEDLEQEPLPKKLPISIGIGTYQSIIKRNGLSLPEKVAVYPKGIYASLYVTIDNVKYVSSEQLQPLIDYVKEHNLRFVGDTTAFLHRIDHSGDKSRIIYRLRIQVEPKIDDDV